MQCIHQLCFNFVHIHLITVNYIHIQKQTANLQWEKSSVYGCEKKVTLQVVIIITIHPSTNSCIRFHIIFTCVSLKSNNFWRPRDRLMDSGGLLETVSGAFEIPRFLVVNNYPCASRFSTRLLKLNSNSPTGVVSDLQHLSGDNIFVLWWDQEGKCECSLIKSDTLAKIKCEKLGSLSHFKTQLSTLICHKHTIHFSYFFLYHGNVDF